MTTTTTEPVKYETQANGSKMMEDILSGRIKQIDGVWYWTEWHVAYAQQGVDTSTNFVTLKDAEENFAKRLEQCRESWGHNGSKFSEVESERPNGGKSVRFRSVLKSGKPGKLTGILYMDRIRRQR